MKRSSFQSNAPVTMVLLVLALANRTTVLAGAIDASLLPTPATNQIDFVRDIKPIFDRSCIRCHGPERPKARFRACLKNDERHGIKRVGEA